MTNSKSMIRRGPRRPAALRHDGAPRRAAATAVVAAVAVLATGCGGLHMQVGTSVVTGRATFRAELAYARCMRTHGVPGFPEPTNSSQVFHITGHFRGKATGHASGKVAGPLARANEACDHLLPPGSVTSGRGQ